MIEQSGVIRVFENSRTAAVSSIFLNISSQILYGGEQGLLGLAFHPDYAVNGYFYVNYVTNNPVRTVIARYSVSPNNPNQALNDSEFILFEVDQPFANHKGGQVAFGPDGYLYVGLGDGGSGGDPLGNGQNRSTLLGKILRVNVDLPSLGRNYSIPQDNPFVGGVLGYREEIYAYGFRNPWRFSFDSVGRLWVADVGQDRREEIDLVGKGKNYGWNIMEGSLNYSGGSNAGLELPVWEYDHSVGIAVIGGYVYYGSSLTGLQSKYVYGDYGSGRVWSLQVDGVSAPVNTLLAETGLSISSFGVDEQNELYFCSLDGKIYAFGTITPTATPLPTAAPTATVPPTAPVSSSTALPTLSLTGSPNPSATSAVSASPFPSPTASATITPGPVGGSGFPIAYVLIIVGLVVAIIAMLVLLFLRKKK